MDTRSCQAAGKEDQKEKVDLRIESSLQKPFVVSSILKFCEIHTPLL